MASTKKRRKSKRSYPKKRISKRRKGTRKRRSSYKRKSRSIGVKKMRRLATKRTQHSFNPLVQIPDRTFYKSHFHAVYSVINDTTSQVVKYFNMNNLRDPDPTMTPSIYNYPTGFNYFSKFYRYYRVSGAKLYVRLFIDQPDSADHNWNFYNLSYNLAVIPLASMPGPPPANWEDAIQTARVKWQKVSMGTRFSSKPLKIYQSVAAIEGVSKENFRNQGNLVGATAANFTGGYVGQLTTTPILYDPAKVPQFFVLIMPTSGEYSSAALIHPRLKMEIRMTMYTEVFQRKSSAADSEENAIPQPGPIGVTTFEPPIFPYAE